MLEKSIFFYCEKFDIISQLFYFFYKITLYIIRDYAIVEKKTEINSRKTRKNVVKYDILYIYINTIDVVYV